MSPSFLPFEWWARRAPLPYPWSLPASSCHPCLFQGSALVPAVSPSPSPHIGPLNWDVLNSGAPLAASTTVLCTQAHRVWASQPCSELSPALTPSSIHPFGRLVPAARLHGSTLACCLSLAFSGHLSVSPTVFLNSIYSLIQHLWSRFYTGL